MSNFICASIDCKVLPQYFSKGFQVFQKQQDTSTEKSHISSLHQLTAYRGCTFFLQSRGRKGKYVLGINDQLRVVTFNLLRLNWLQNSQSHKKKKKNPSQASDCFQCSQWSWRIGQTFQIVQYQIHSFGFTTRPSHKIRFVPGELETVPSNIHTSSRTQQASPTSSDTVQGKEKKLIVDNLVDIFGNRDF